MKIGMEFMNLMKINRIKIKINMISKINMMENQVNTEKLMQIKEKTYKTVKYV